MLYYFITTYTQAFIQDLQLGGGGGGVRQVKGHVSLEIFTNGKDLGITKASANKSNRTNYYYYHDGKFHGSIWIIFVLVGASPKRL